MKTYLAWLDKLKNFCNHCNEEEKVLAGKLIEEYNDKT
jgi:hypothetical protein